LHKLNVSFATRSKDLKRHSGWAVDETDGSEARFVSHSSSSS
jgi:hypothetical protein